MSLSSVGAATAVLGAGTVGEVLGGGGGGGRPCHGVEPGETEMLRRGWSVKIQRHNYVHVHERT